MSQMLGNSRTWQWALCACRHCRSEREPRSMFYFCKRAARRREERLWRREQT